MWIESHQADIVLTRTVVWLTGGFFLKHYSHNSIYLLVSHENVQYVSNEVCIECFIAKDLNISVLIQGQETLMGISSCFVPCINSIKTLFYYSKLMHTIVKS